MRRFISGAAYLLAAHVVRRSGEFVSEKLGDELPPQLDVAICLGSQVIATICYLRFLELIPEFAKTA